MQLTNIILGAALLVSSTVVASPVEERTIPTRNLIFRKDCEWVCQKWVPECSQGYWPKWCPVWGKNEMCKDWYDGCDQKQSYCCKGNKCW